MPRDRLPGKQVPSMKYAFVGGGNMGRALAAALIGQGVCLPGDIYVVEPDEERRKRVALLGCEVAEQSSAELGKAPVVMLAVKPQQAQIVFAEVRPHLKQTQVVVSIMAGIPLATLRDGLAHDGVVRAMPNTPAQVGLGMNVYIADPSVTGKRLAPVESLLRSAGEVLQVESEDLIDAATAICGSGPAYVFYVAEHWMNAAQSLGFTQEQAAQLVQQTLIGATALWKDAGKTPAVLRQEVTSKGGTTAAALDTFNRCECGKHLQEGIVNAYRRAKELAG